MQSHRLLAGGSSNRSDRGEQRPAPQGTNSIDCGTSVAAKTTMGGRGSLASPLLVLLLLNPAHSLLAPREAFRATARVAAPSRSAPQMSIYQQQPRPPNEPRERAAPSGDDFLAPFAFHWESLLRREHHGVAAELKRRRRSYARSQLEASGLALFDAVAAPETELHGEKVVRVTVPQRARCGGGDRAGDKLRGKFRKGDALVLTPQVKFRGKDVPPREGLVMDVGGDHLTLGVGASWPAGVMEMRKHDNYRVRLDRSLSTAPLRAQCAALDRLRRDEAGSAASLLARLFADVSPSSLDMARETPSHFDDEIDLEGRIENAIDEAMSLASFEPNASQREAVVWALSRKLALIRGPPGTGKTRIAALLISTALKIAWKQTASEDEERNSTSLAPRVLAVTHSNGAADVLLQALLDMNVPAVRAGRPASVSPSVQHRTIAALSERMPEVVRLRQQAADVTLERQARQAALYDSKQCLSDAQTTIAKTAPVAVTSCISAQQLLSSIGESEKTDGSPFPIVVLDEAAQTTEPAFVCALAAAKACQVILVGDTQQLPPTVTTQDAELRKTIGVSPMERLMKNGMDEFVLKEQYRMPPSLLRHPSDYFYDGVVRCARAGGADPNAPPPGGFPWPSPRNEPLAFLEVGNDSEVAHNFGGRSNPTEAEIIVDIVERVIAAGDIHAENIAIITPYSKQVQLLRAALMNSTRNIASKISDVRIGTVDSFQGQETDLVLFSAVRSNLLKELGFLRDARRLNVAITRARRGLIVVGDPETLRTCRHWAALLDHCSGRGCNLTQDEYNANSNGEQAVRMKSMNSVTN